MVFGATAATVIGVAGLAISAGSAIAGGGGSGSSGGSGGGGGGVPNTTTPIPSNSSPGIMQDSKAAAAVQDNYNPAQQIQDWHKAILSAGGQKDEDAS